MANNRRVNAADIAGARMGQKMRLIGEAMMAELSEQDRLAFWLAVAREVTTAIDECTDHDSTTITRH